MADDDLTDRLLKWEEAWEHGEDMPAAALCPDRPELTVPLQRRIDRLKQMAWMTSGADDGPVGGPGPDPLVGTTLAVRYRLDRLIAEGGFGRVYEGHDLELHRTVAVKVARQGIADEYADLLAEARRAAKLRHPGLVAVHDVGRDNSRAFIVSELVGGRSLAETIAADRPTPADAARLVAEVADALDHAHRQGFVHRDIKPQNILIDGSGRPLVTDFGLAADAGQIARGAGAMSGTLAYMAPEQVAGEVQLVGPGTDVYALGVVLYELLAGRHPHPARTPAALREQVLFRPPEPVRSLNPAVSPELEAACLRCLAKHPADRFPSAAALAAALRSSPPRHRYKLSRRSLLAGLAGGVAFGAGALVGRWTARPVASIAEVSPVGPPEEAGVLRFDGRSRIVTPLERFAPVTLEAWVRPSRYVNNDIQFVIGSDIPTKHGIGLGINEVILCAEYIPGMAYSEGVVPLGRFSHVAVVFGPENTRLYVDGRKVGAGPATRPDGGTPFVVGCIGRGNPIKFFVGAVRSLRISTGERYTDEFVPEERFVPDAAGAAVRAVLIYDGSAVEGETVIDLSGADNHGQWDRLPP